METKYELAKEKLKKYHQEHLLVCYDKLIGQKQEELLDQILKVDFDHIKELYDKIETKKDFDQSRIQPLHYIDKQKLSKEEKEKYFSKGLEQIKQGKYAVVTMAGGQGTRLGHNRTKGNF